MLDPFFSTANALAMIGWTGLVGFAVLPRVVGWIAGVGIPLILSIGYAALMLAFWSQSEGGYGSLADVAQLFDTRGVLLAGWVHYLAFDLFIGGWIVRDADARGLSHWLAVPCLPLTFLFGPAGLLAWFTLRIATTKRATSGATA